MLWPNPDKPNTIVSQTPGTYQFTPLSGALAILLALWCWLLLGPILALATQSLPDSTITEYLTVNIPFLAMAMGLYLGSHFIMKVPFKALVSSSSPIRWHLVFTSAAAYAIVLLLFFLAGSLSNPDQYLFQASKAMQRVALLPLVLLLTPIQTTAEELLFRIIPARTFFKGQLPSKKASILLSSTLTCILFTVPHLSNRELFAAQNKAATILYYAIFGFVVTYISIKAKGFEPALGLHAANNLFIALFCNYPDSSLPSLPLFIDTKPVGTIQDVLILVVGLGVVAWVSSNRKSKNQ